MADPDVAYDNDITCWRRADVPRRWFDQQSYRTHTSPAKNLFDGKCLGANREPLIDSGDADDAVANAFDNVA